MLEYCESWWKISMHLKVMRMMRRGIDLIPNLKNQWILKYINTTKAKSSVFCFFCFFCVIFFRRLIENNNTLIYASRFFGDDYYWYTTKLYSITALSIQLHHSCPIYSNFFCYWTKRLIVKSNFSHLSICKVINSAIDQTHFNIRFVKKVFIAVLSNATNYEAFAKYCMAVVNGSQPLCWTLNVALL